MAEPFLSEIRMFSFNFAPVGWATCDGQSMQITQNQALYSLLGIIFGGNGTSYFNLPDLRGRTPLHFSSGYAEGSKGGQENVILNTQQIPAHTHALQSTSAMAQSDKPANNVLALLTTGKADYTTSANLVTMNNSAIALAGGSNGHNNMQPSLVVNFCIALQGIYPSRN